VRALSTKLVMIRVVQLDADKDVSLLSTLCRRTRVQRRGKHRICPVGCYLSQFSGTCIVACTLTLHGGAGADSPISAYQHCYVYLTTCGHEVSRCVPRTCGYITHGCCGRLGLRPEQRAWLLSLAAFVLEQVLKLWLAG